MKLNSLPDEADGFKAYPVEFCGIESYLIIPNIDAKWNKTNLHFRSLIVRGSDFEVCSSGLKKFFNYSEKPDAYPNPEKYKDWIIQTKMDGSLLIADYINNQFSMRTRGTASYITQNNASDFEELLVKYPLVLEQIKLHPNLSLHFEIVTPNNWIVIPYPEIDFIFLGAVDKNTLETISFNDFQAMGKLMEVPMPELHSFNNLTEIIEIVNDWKGREGVVLSYNNYGDKIKIKAEDYLIKHRLKSELNSEQNFVEFYVSVGMPDYQGFFSEVEKVVDFETATAFRGRISKVVDAGKEVKRILEHMEQFVASIKSLKTRKEQAEMIIGSYGPTNRAAFLFALLDGKTITKDQIIKIFWQILKSN